MEKISGGKVKAKEKGREIDMDQIFYNGNIHIMDEARTVVSALAVKDGRVAAIGSDEEILTLKGEGTQITDLKGRTAIPGLTDTHLHLVIYGRSLSEVDLMGARSVKEVIRRGQEFLKNNTLAEGQWLIGGGWNEQLFEDEKRVITRDDLDQISTEIPISFARACHHMEVCNSKALEIAGLVPGQQVEAGEIETVDGRLTGVLKELATRIIRPYYNNLTKDALKKHIEAGVNQLAAYGITTAHADDFINADPYDVVAAYNELKEEGKLKVRIYQQCRFPGPEGLQEFIDRGYAPRSGDDMYRIGSLKLLADGSLGARTAAMVEDYSDAPGQKGMFNFSDEMFDAMIQTAQKNDMPVAIHAIGDYTIGKCIDAIAKAKKVYPKDHNVRHGIVHCQITSADQLKRIAEEEIVAHIQPIFIASDSKIVEARTGERAKTSYSWKTLKDLGVPIPFGTDSPIETPNPFENIYCAVTRCDLDGKPEGGWRPEEKLTVDEAVEAITVTAAYSAYQEKDKGTLEAGKLADMVVLSDDIFSIPEEKIKDLSAELTVRGGEIVYSK